MIMPALAADPCAGTPPDPVADATPAAGPAPCRTPLTLVCHDAPVLSARSATIHEAAACVKALSLVLDAIGDREIGQREAAFRLGLLRDRIARIADEEQEHLVRRYLRRKGYLCE